MVAAAFKEVAEVAKTATKEVGKTTNAFENAKNKFKDIASPTHIETRNQNLEGDRHPDTGVLYERKTFILNGNLVEGVFPIFESKFDTGLPRNIWKASDVDQFKYCTKKLADLIESDPSFAKQFTPRQIEQINAGSPNISGLTWHHNEIPGKMQLVNTDVHARSGHTGGKSLWGGGR